MGTIRETCNYLLEQDELGNSIIYDKINDCNTKWYVDLEVRDQINLIKHFKDEEFDEYCRVELIRKPSE